MKVEPKTLDKMGKRKFTEEFIEGKIPFQKNIGDDFSVYLEHKYFEPGTEKNKEFQAAVVPSKKGTLLLWNIKDTEENRDILEKAMRQYYGRKPKITDQKIEKMRSKLKGKIRNG